LLSPQTLLKTNLKYIIRHLLQVASKEVIQACVAKSVIFYEFWLISQFGNFNNFVNFAKSPKHVV